MDYPKIIFRTDGNSEIGLGHLMRCLALSQMLKEHFSTIVFFLKEPDGSICNIIRKEGFQVVSIIEEEEFLKSLSGEEIVVLDGYHFNTSFQQRVKAVGSLLVCIDDLHDKHFVADILINQAPGVKLEEYAAETYTRYLLGTNYALLRPKFLKQANALRIIPALESVLICFGGSDIKNLTQKALENVVQFDSFKKIIVITGVGYKFGRELSAFISDHNGGIVHLHGIDEENMINCLLSVQLAIIPASGILFEVIACKTPAISGYYIDNQRDIYKGFRALNAFYDAIDFSSDNLQKALRLAIDSDPSEQVEYQSSCIDGKSPRRYIEALTSLSHKFTNS